ncbi:MAG: bifunctional shikimate kinase/3-dehydroquinate synthase, partial [Anaerolineales bacterium]|nr:bifunctional shikimate kinase/3-dehydroquinate synthase [Anaerolineales bacterium]
MYGPPGSGKTAAGRALGASLKIPFKDLDTQIVEKAGQSIAGIFSAEGEAGFRKREKDALRKALQGYSGVLALGGGALLDEENIKLAAETGELICLHAAAGVLQERLKSSRAVRPLLENGEEGALERLLERRAAHYRSFEKRIATDALTPEEVAWEIQLLLGRYRVPGMGGGYSIFVDEGLLQQVGSFVQTEALSGPVCVVGDDQVLDRFGGEVVAAIADAGYDAAAAGFPAGEQSKSIATIEALWEQFLEQKLERGSTIVSLGGGVVSDIAGFAAATYMRGVSWVVVPTSLLAMVDAGIGGKTGVDLPQGKNLVGAFHPPRIVLADPDALRYLPETEIKSGLAEVVKHGVIGDPLLFAQCESGYQ